MMKRFCTYVEKVFGWSEMLARVRDSRVRPQIPGATILTGLMMMFATCLKSLNAFEGQLRMAGRWEKIVGERKPSADTLGRVAGLFDTACLRGFLSETLHFLRRAKMLDESPWALRFAVLDGHEFFSQ